MLSHGSVKAALIGGWSNVLHFQSCLLMGLDLGIRLELCAVNRSRIPLLMSAWLLMETTRQAILDLHWEDISEGQTFHIVLAYSKMMFVWTGLPDVALLL